MPSHLLDCHHGDGVPHLLGTLRCPESGWGPGICKLLSCLVGAMITVILSGGSSGSLCLSSPVREARGPGQPRHLRLDEQGG